MAPMIISGSGGFCEEATRNLGGSKNRLHTLSINEHINLDGDDGARVTMLPGHSLRVYKDSELMNKRRKAAIETMSRAINSTSSFRLILNALLNVRSKQMNRLGSLKS